MKIYLANSSKMSRGGGWTFLRNFRKGMGDLITDNYEEATVYFIPGATMVTRDEVKKAKDDGKKVILRVDNVVRNSRNRNTGMTRMKDFAEWADLVVFQSEWAMKYLGRWLFVEGVNTADKVRIVINGTDLEVFHPGSLNEVVYLYTRENRDETKNWEMARYYFSQMTYKPSRLNIVGNFSSELVEGNFDFYQDEEYKYWGSQPLETLADIYRQSSNFLYTYFMDACSNSLIEALASGCEIVNVFGMADTGGAPEILKAYNEKGTNYLSLHRMCREYKEAIGGVL